jgi:hypothetical protein
MSLGQKGRNQFVEARSVGPQAVDENDAGFALICQKFAPGKNVSFALRFNLVLRMLYGVVSLHPEYTAMHKNVRFAPSSIVSPAVMNASGGRWRVMLEGINTTAKFTNCTSGKRAQVCQLDA